MHEQLTIFEQFKLCSRCGESKPLAEFSKHRGRRDGLDTVCRVCNLARVKRWQEENPERERARQAKYHEENSSVIRQKRAIHYQANRKRVLERQRIYREANRERKLAYGRAYRERNRERLAEQQREYRKRNAEYYANCGRNHRALLAGADGTHTLSEVLGMLEHQGNQCAYCETPLDANFEVDHMMPLSRGGLNDWTNLAVACCTCNVRKGAKTAEEFWEYITA